MDISVTPLSVTPPSPPSETSYHHLDESPGGSVFGERVQSATRSAFENLGCKKLSYAFFTLVTVIGITTVIYSPSVADDSCEDSCEPCKGACLAGFGLLAAGIMGCFLTCLCTENLDDSNES